MTTINNNEPAKAEQQKEISLSDLATPTTETKEVTPIPNLPGNLPKFDPNKTREVSIGNIKANEDKIKKEQEESELPEELRGQNLTKHQAQAIARIDDAIDRLANESAELAAKGEAIRAEKAAEAELDEDVTEEDNIQVTNSPVSTKKKHIVAEDDLDIFDDAAADKESETKKAKYEIDEDLTDVDLDLLDEDEDEEESEENNKEVVEQIKNKIRQDMKEKFKPISNPIDLDSFTISKKPISVSKVFVGINEKAKPGAVGVIWSHRKAVKMTAFTTTEIEKLGTPTDDYVNRYDYVKEKIQLIYNHIVDSNKPDSFEAWAKLQNRDTIDDYFFTAYKATFGKSNIITYTCPDEKCNNVEMKERSIYDMIKFKNSEVETEYKRILTTGATDSEYTKPETIKFQISDDFVVALRKPSLYSSFVEPSLIPTEFVKKYQDFMLLISYIDSIYVIDREHNTLNKIDTKAVAGNPALSAKRKIKSYHKILSSLTSDQIQALSYKTDLIDDVEVDPETDEPILPIVYQYPEDKCEKCGGIIKAYPESPDRMLFMRHRLGLMLKM